MAFKLKNSYHVFKKMYSQSRTILRGWEAITFKIPDRGLSYIRIL